MSAPNRLRAPVTSKFTVRAENERIKYAVSSMQGWRPYMEDAFAALLDLDDSNSTSFFGVYDGHGGADVALYCSKRFHTELVKDEAYHSNLALAMERVCFRIDEQMKQSDEWRELANPRRRGIGYWITFCLSLLPTPDPYNIIGNGATGIPRPPKEPTGPPQDEGSTACVALIRGNQIIVGNVGDSRCILSKNGQAKLLSIDHKPTHRTESQRIREAGGHVTRHRFGIPTAQGIRLKWDASRVEGKLGMSRAIGDFSLKQNKDLPAEAQMVTCKPTICIVDITDDTEFLVIASDGIWDLLSNQKVIDFVRGHLQSGGTDLGVICEKLLDRCLGSNDNSTAILVQFKTCAGIPPLPAEPVVIDDPTTYPNLTADDDIKLDPTASGIRTNPNLTAGGGDTKLNPTADARTSRDADADAIASAGTVTEADKGKGIADDPEADEEESDSDEDEDRPFLPASSLQES